MDLEKQKTFIQKTDNFLPTIRSNSLICIRDGNTHGELHAALHQIRTIRSEAAIAGLTIIEQTAEIIENDLKNPAAANLPLTEEQSRKLLDDLAILEAFLTDFTFSQEAFSLDVSDFIEESFDNLQINNLPVKAATVEVETEEEFEIDDEMREIFALEAEELLRNINTNLEILEVSPNNREALLEIRRSAHTLKGSAGIIGLQKLSSLSHRVEDLLDYLAEKEIEADVRVFEILLTATDCLETLANGEFSLQLKKKLVRLYDSFDEILSQLKEKSNLKDQPAKIVDAANLNDGQTAISGTNENRSTIRVSLNKLDELVKIVGDLLVSRSVFEQRLVEFNRQIEELQINTNRMQQATGNLEIDFGTNQFYTPNSKFPVNTFSFESSQRVISEFDSLEFDRYSDFHQLAHELVETTADAASISSELDTLKDSLELLFEGQRRSIEEMQEKLLRLRMVKFGTLSARFQRNVRVTCEEEEKFAELIIEGENLEFDTQILDALVEPLLHLLRNAVAHGIEPPETRRLLGKSEVGKIGLKIFSDGTHVNLIVTDDGRGISAPSLIEKAIENNLITRGKAEKLSEEEAFELMYLPGLTTAARLSQVAGRGVGMNIVKTNITRHQGTISTTSKLQKGSVFTIRLPMALAVTRSILVKSDGRVFAFPLKNFKGVTEVSAILLKSAISQNSLKIDETAYTPTYLNELLGLSQNANFNNKNLLLLIETKNQNFALIVDEIVRTEEIIIKPFGFPLQNQAGFLGATILGDGSIVPVIDLIYLLETQEQPSENTILHQESEVNLENEPISATNSQLSVMIVDDSPSLRYLTTKLVKNAGWNTLIAKDGLEALEILQSSPDLPNIILTDVEMPRMNGYELLSALKQQETLRQIPVIMITSRTGDKHRQKALELGVNEYLTKPFQDTVLIEKIKILTES
ncbi:hypothetical protein BH10ACI1_BH10ACI1_10060 [soil metagenome]